MPDAADLGPEALDPTDAEPMPDPEAPDLEPISIHAAVEELLGTVYSEKRKVETGPWPGGLDTWPAPAKGGELCDDLSPDPPEDRPAWEGLHKLLGPWFPGRLAVLVGTTGSGKTAFAVQVAEAYAARLPVVYASGELDRAELVARLVSVRARGEGQCKWGVAWRDLALGRAEKPAIEAACHALVEDCPGLYLWAPTAMARTVARLSPRVRAVAEKHGKPPLVVVDYVQRFAPSNDPYKRQAVSDLSGELRELSRPDPTTGYPGAAMLALSSTARSYYSHFLDCDALKLAVEGGTVIRTKETSDGKKEVRVKIPPVPMVGTGKESGELEYDAPLHLCLATNPPKDDDRPGTPRPALVAVTKNRHGNRGLVDMEFLPACGLFRDARPKKEKKEPMEEIPC